MSNTTTLPVPVNNQGAALPVRHGTGTHSFAAPGVKSVGSCVPSYAHGVSRLPLLGQTIGENLRATAERCPDREALVVRSQDYRATYRQLWDATTACARGLLALGVRPGDRVGVWSANRFEWVVVQYATARLGAVLVNINPAYRAGELEYVLRQAGVSVLLYAASFKQAAYGPMLEAARPRCPELRHAVLIDREWEALLRGGENTDTSELQRIESTLQFDDPINIQYTSGTTGFPKGATLTHHNILNNAYSIGAGLGYTEADRVCIPVPFYHCFGMVMGNLACTSHGACMVIPGEWFQPRAVLEAVQAERCTSLYGVPTMFLGVLEEPDFERFDCSSLRTGIMAGAPCPVELMKQVVTRLHMPEVAIAYGMTETSPISTLIDEAGWMHSGDLALMEADGYVRIVGRLKDMIIRGGENISPREIEEVLTGHPAVSEAQVIGVPSRKCGEEVMAWVRPRPGAACAEQELVSFCRGRLAPYKVPRYWQFVETFPLTVTGKIQKFKLREMAVALLGRHADAAEETA